MPPVLNTASRVYLGDGRATRAYLGTTRVFDFNPTSIAGCMLWLDASKLKLANGATVTSWPNLGSAPNPTVSGSTTFRTNSLNSLPVVRLARGSGRIRWYSGTGVDKDWTLVYVGRRWQVTSGRVITASLAAANLLVGFWSNAMEQCYVEGWVTPSGSPSTTIAWKLYSADSSSTAPARFFFNGSLVASGAATPAKGWGGTLYISGYSDDANPGTSEESDCEIAELVMYNRKLSDTERPQVENYLRQKWNPGALFKPSDMGSNCLAWFNGADASSVQIAGSGVSDWINRGTGSTMGLTQSTDSNRPTYANQIVTFTTPQMLVASNPIATGYEVIWVGRPKPASVNDWRTFIRNVTAPHLVIIEMGSTRFGVFNGGFFPAGTLTWDQVWGIGYGQFADSAVAMLALNGGPLTSTTTTIATGNTVPNYWGAYQGPAPSQGWGDVKEIVLVPYGTQYKVIMEGYLAFKWGLGQLLPAGHPYKYSPPYG